MTTEDDKADDRSAFSGLKNPNVWAISITASIIASILFAVIFQPILNGAGKLAVSWLSTFASSFVDRSYEQAPIAATNVMIFQFIAIFTGIMTGLGVLAILVSSGITPRFLQRRKVEKTEEGDNATPPKRLGRRARAIVKVGTFLFGFLTIFLYNSMAVRHYITIQANATFERQIMALKPHISDHEEEDLYSDWANVRTKIEYEALMKKIAELSKERQANIPRRFI